jgi:hypothetical protein
VNYNFQKYEILVLSLNNFAFKLSLICTGFIVKPVHFLGSATNANILEQAKSFQDTTPKAIGAQGAKKPW